MTDRKKSLDVDATWIGEALIPRWLMFRRSFVEKTNLTPVVVQDYVTGIFIESEFNGVELFPAGAYWTDIDIENPSSSKLDIRYTKSMDDWRVWDLIQTANAVVWCPQAQAYAACAGSDSFCLLAKRPAIEAAFGCSLETLDALLFDRVRETLDQLEQQRPFGFDDVWCRNFAWVRCFR